MLRMEVWEDAFILYRVVWEGLIDKMTIQTETCREQEKNSCEYLGEEHFRQRVEK